MRRASSGSGHRISGVPGPRCGTRAGRRRRCRRSSGSPLPWATAARARRSCPASRSSGARVAGSKANSSPSRASSTASGHCTTWSPRLKALRRKMSPMSLPQTTTSSRPFSSATPFSPAGLISRDEPMANRSPAMRKFSPRCTRARKSGIRWRKEPAFQRSSSVSRLSETQSAAGVIWSVSIASSFLPGTFGSQKMSALPRIAGAGTSAAASEGRGPGSVVLCDARFQARGLDPVHSHHP